MYILINRFTDSSVHLTANVFLSVRISEHILPKVYFETEYILKYI